MLLRAAALLAVACLLGAAYAWREMRHADVASAQAPAGVQALSVAGDPAVAEPAAITSPLDCPRGTLPQLEIARFPRGSEHGGATPAAALWALEPDAGALVMRPFGSQPSAPVWIVAGDRTFIATMLPDASWFVSPAKFVRCMALPTER